MKQNKLAGSILFLFAIGFFGLQLGYLLIHERYQVEYIDNRLFYIINIFCVISLFLALLFLLRLNKRSNWLGAAIVGLFIIVNVALLFDSNKDVINVTSISPDFKHVLSIKKDVKSGESFYYRSYYGLLGRPKDKLPGEAIGNFKVKWLANDIAAVTYNTTNQTIQQFIGTYGDRKNGMTYYYVGAEIHGEWQGKNIEVISNQQGITVIVDNKTELFSWENIEQFGTLAVVLKKNDQAAWTISLNENFVVHSDTSEPTVGNIRLYKATMEKNQPITLHYKTAN
ncbi:hypothetical protein [Neobacillus sp. LXY-4]|uniref:hypothetical protein n=1 Tax=Neobacillus sp. LXY-4 TaxID=3379826 RepID=UPI003EDFAB3D